MTPEQRRVLRSLADGGDIQTVKATDPAPIVRRRNRKGRLYGSFRPPTGVLESLMGAGWIEPTDDQPILLMYGITESGRAALSE